MEAAELALFMISACIFTVLLYHPASPVLGWIPNSTLRRLLMGIAMGLTAIAIIKCPWGKRSGAHFNPSITLTFLRLGKIGLDDARFYILFQFFGGIAGVGISALLLGHSIANPAVNYAVTIPGPRGPAAAFAAEAFMAALLMAAVLITSNSPRLAPWTTWLMGVLIACYILLFAPISGFSINPARTFGSALFAHLWTAIWIYFTAPILGMLFSAEMYLRLSGTHPRHRHYFSHRHLSQQHVAEAVLPIARPARG
jgi:aquaporin Z